MAPQKSYISTEFWESDCFATSLVLRVLGKLNTKGKWDFRISERRIDMKRYISQLISCTKIIGVVEHKFSKKNVYHIRSVSFFQPVITKNLTTTMEDLSWKWENLIIVTNSKYSATFISNIFMTFSLPTFPYKNYYNYNT